MTGFDRSLILSTGDEATRGIAGVSGFCHSGDDGDRADLRALIVILDA
jgi:hypothetical protein